LGASQQDKATQTQARRPRRALRLRKRERANNTNSQPRCATRAYDRQGPKAKGPTKLKPTNDSNRNAREKEDKRARRRTATGTAWQTHRSASNLEKLSTTPQPQDECHCKITIQPTAKVKLYANKSTGLQILLPRVQAFREVATIY
jgi:hypothetical protein